MKSLAIIRATDILTIKSTLQEMETVGLTIDGKPKEISIVSAEKILSKIFDMSDKIYEVCTLVPLNQDHSLSINKIKNISPYSDVVVLDNSNEIFNYLVRMIPALPDMVFPSAYYKEVSKQSIEKKERTSRVYLSAFVDKKVMVQTISDSNLTGILKNADPIGVFLEPSDGTSPIFITWHDIKKVIIPKDGNKLS